MKHVYALLLMVGFFSSCYGQNKPGLPTTKIRYETPNYTYTDATGKRLLIKNNGPKSGINYTDPKGKKYIYAVFWTQIINETDTPVQLNINFSLDSFELPSSPGNHIKLLLPRDTMTLGKAPLYDYGLAVKSFLDNDIHKSSSLTRTINPNESSGFYVVTLSDHGVNGTLRTGLVLKGQNLFYSVNEKEILCGTVNLKFTLQD